MKKQVTLLQSAIPPKRGVATHFERYDEMATTVFSPDGKVKEIHTPQDSLRRVHEVMHAKHTRLGDYKGRREEVREVIEDCRLHMKHWPWAGKVTPQIVVDDAKKLFADEAKRKAKALKEHGKIDSFADFASQLRMSAVYRGMGIGRRRPLSTEAYERFSRELHSHIRHGRHEHAAYMLEQAFFGHLKDEDKPEAERRPEEGEGESERSKRKERDERDETLERELKLDRIPEMEIIELPFVEETNHAEKGFRLTTTGSRIYRPALRRPILPHRLFLKQSPVAPGGTVMFDASGSMEVDNEKLLDCCRRAPAATVAFYSGDDDGTSGTLYVFAKNGMRATNINDCDQMGGNAVDGAAMDWLMEQEGPRIFVTDEQFCGSADSLMQIVRLQALKEAGEIEVYHSYHAFQEQFPPVAEAA